MAVYCLNFIWIYLPDTVKTKFRRYQTDDDEDIHTKEGGVLPLFPKKGHLIGSQNIRKGKIINMEQHEFF